MVKIVVTAHTDKVHQQKTVNSIEKARELARKWTLKYGHCVSLETDRDET